MNKLYLMALGITLVLVGCKDPEPLTRCVIDRVEVLEIDPDYVDDTIEEGAPDLYVEWIDAESQSVIFASGVAQEAQLPVNLDFVGANIEEVDFWTPYEFTVFDADVATTQDFIALGLPFRAGDYVDAESRSVDISDGLTTIRVHLIWY